MLIGSFCWTAVFGPFLRNEMRRRRRNATAGDRGGVAAVGAGDHDVRPGRPAVCRRRRNRRRRRRWRRHRHRRDVHAAVRGSSSRARPGGSRSGPFGQRERLPLPARRRDSRAALPPRRAEGTATQQRRRKRRFPQEDTQMQGNARGRSPLLFFWFPVSPVDPAASQTTTPGATSGQTE